MSLADDLRAAKALIDTPEKWGKGHYERKGRMCSIGAIRRVTGTDPLAVNHTHSYKALREALSADYRDDGVIDFNDHPATTHADIMALFQRAIDAAEQSEASS